MKNSLALIVILLGCAGYSWYQHQPIPIPIATASPLPPATPSPISTAPTPVKPAPASLAVTILKNPLRCEESQLQEFLFSEFANRSEPKGVESYTSINWQRNFTVFSAKLVGSARTQQLNAQSLAKALDLILKDADGLAYLPVGAFHARLNDRLVWIVPIKWEGVEMGQDGLGHIRIFVYDQETLVRVAFATCG